MLILSALIISMRNEIHPPPWRETGPLGKNDSQRLNINSQILASAFTKPASKCRLAFEIQLNPDMFLKIQPGQTPKGKMKKETNWTHWEDALSSQKAFSPKYVFGYIDLNYLKSKTPANFWYFYLILILHTPLISSSGMLCNRA